MGVGGCHFTGVGIASVGVVMDIEGVGAVYAHIYGGGFRAVAAGIIHVQIDIQLVLKNREKLIKSLSKVQCITEIYPTDANFVLVKTTDADAIYNYLINKGIVTRNRNGITLCDNCIRITVGTAVENKQVISALKTYKK